MESVAPNIFVKDINATIAFYEQLGFEKIMTVPEKGEYDWVMMTNKGVTFMFQTLNSLGDILPEIKRSDGGSLLFYIRMMGVRAFYDKIKEKVRVIVALNKTFYGATEFSIVDNNGYVLTFAEDEA